MPGLKERHEVDNAQANTGSFTVRVSRPEQFSVVLEALFTEGAVGERVPHGCITSIALNTNSVTVYYAWGGKLSDKPDPFDIMAALRAHELLRHP
jgi:hypothetical protein